MAGFDYLKQGGPLGRARCHCPINDLADVNQKLKSIDPTKKPGKNGYISWTKQDSNTTGIDHQRLYEAYVALSRHELICSAKRLPGCNYTFATSWSSDQKERILAILEKRTPKPDHWNFSPKASENLKKMGIKVRSPYSLDPKNYATNEPKPVYRKDPSAKAITLTRKGKTIIQIPLANTTFVNITHGEDKDTGDWTNVEILIHYDNGRITYGRIKDGKIIDKQIDIDPALYHPQ